VGRSWAPLVGRTGPFRAALVGQPGALARVGRVAGRGLSVTGNRPNRPAGYSRRGRVRASGGVY
jgi:hypothetical protein